MKLSVFVTSYKFKNYIKECVDSVLSQSTNFPIEVIIRDDGTNDGTYEMLVELYGKISNVKILDSSKNLGAVKNILLCMSNCRGEYLAQIDGDDMLIDNNYYQRAVEYLDSHPNYSLYCSGYRYLEEGVVSPVESWLCSGVLDMELKDLLIENYVSSGRVFRNTKMDESIFENIVYPDWAFNFELLKRGRAFCDNSNCVYLYRIHTGGMFSKKSEEEKQKNKENIIEELTQRYNMFKQKTITIVDSFVYSDSIREKLIRTLNWMREDGHEVLLISNTIVDKEILGKVKFYLYDSRNQLFEENYPSGNLVDFWKIINDGLEIHDLVPETQKHGLSVLINLFNALHYARAQGYTHFQRLEVDDLFGINSREYIRQVPIICEKNEKRGLFYHNSEKTPPDTSFHYFYCNIDDFLNKVPRISKEQDYIDYLVTTQGNRTFKIVEVFLYENMKKNGDGEFLLKNGAAQMYSDFPDTRWNTETSISSFDTKYGKCTTKLYYINEYDKENNLYKRGNTYMLLTYSYHSDRTNRKIKLSKNNGEEFYIHHETNSAGGWMWNEVPVDIKSISVYENEKLLYTEYASDCLSYVNFKR
jgi:glycosyltransferase involved in cell wall biosynthesis